MTKQKLNSTGSLSRMAVPGGYVYYSYQTPIAFNINFEIRCRVNDWGNATAKHMFKLANEYGLAACALRFKAERLPAAEFMAALNAAAMV